MNRKLLSAFCVACALCLSSQVGYCQEFSQEITGPSLNISGSASVGSLSVTGSTDLWGNNLSLGTSSLLSSATTSIPGVSMSFIDSGTSQLRLTAAQPLHDWIWERNGLLGAVPMMRLGADHVLTIYNASGSPAFVLDPLNRSGGLGVLTQGAADGRYVQTSSWNSSSLSIGSQAVAGGTYGTAVGPNATANGGWSVALGRSSTAQSDAAVAVGVASNAAATSSIAIGDNAYASGNRSAAVGAFTNASVYGEFVAGQYNLISQGSASGWVVGEDLLVVGNGSDAQHRSNALAVKKNGNMALGDFDNLPAASRNSAYKLLNLASNPTNGASLITLASRYRHTSFLGDAYDDFIIGTEGANPIIFKYGIQYSSTDPLHTGTESMRIASNGNLGIGTASPAQKLDVAGNIKASTGLAVGDGAAVGGIPSFALGSNSSAQGYNSLAAGYSCAANREYSVAMGWCSNASGHLAFALGDANYASGDSSFSLGYHTQATGNGSTAMGVSTSASQEAAMAMGKLTVASGVCSSASGIGTVSQGYAQWVGGQYNLPQGSGTSGSPTDNLFILGNGADDAHRSNAFVVKRNGDTTIIGNLNITGTYLVSGSAFAGGALGPWVTSGNTVTLGSGSNGGLITLNSNDGTGSFTKIGIGTATPGYNLDVAGNINLTGTLYQNGVPFVGGGSSCPWVTSGSTVTLNSAPNSPAVIALNTGDGSASFANNGVQVSASGNLSTSGGLAVTGTAQMNGAMVVSGTTTVTGGLVVTGSSVAVPDSPVGTKVVGVPTNLVLIPEQGDLSMGEFINGAKPQ